MIAAVPFLTTLILSTSLVAVPDEWPDGIVDRGLQCDIFPDRIEVEMSVGLSDATVVQALESRLPPETPLAETPDGQLDQLRALVLEELRTAVVIEVDGQPMELETVRSEISARHHIRFYCFLESELEPVAGERTFRLFDGSFPDLQNQLRIALRPRGTELIRTNVEPLIVRSDRIYLIDLSREDQSDARTIRATFADPSAPTRGEPGNKPQADEVPRDEESQDTLSQGDQPGSEPRNDSNRVSSHPFETGQIDASNTESSNEEPTNADPSNADSASHQGEGDPTISQSPQAPHNDDDDSHLARQHLQRRLQWGMAVVAALLFLVGCVLLLRSDFANRVLRR